MHLEYPTGTEHNPFPTPNLVLNPQDLDLARLAANTTLAQTQHEFDRIPKGVADAAENAVLASQTDTLSLMSILLDYQNPSGTQNAIHNNRKTEVRATQSGPEFRLDASASEHVLNGLALVAGMDGARNILRRRRFPGVDKTRIAAAQVTVEQFARDAQGWR